MKSLKTNKIFNISKIEKIINYYFAQRIFSRRDSLTGSFSQGVFLEDFKNRNLHPFNYLIDVDNFKHVNETLGPMKASSVLANYIRFIENQIKNAKFKIYRLGGDEFIISSQELLSKKIFNQNYRFCEGHDKIQLSSSAVLLDLKIHAKMNLENEIFRGHSKVKKIKRRKKSYALSVG